MAERHRLRPSYSFCVLVACWFGSMSTGFADLVAHWKLDEGDDTEFLNAVDSTYDGYLFDNSVFVNVVDVVPNADGYGPDQEFAIEFTGDNSWIQTDFPGIGGNEPRTVAFWVKTEVADDAPSHGIVGWGASSTSEKWHIRVNNNAGNGVLGAIRTEPQGGQNVASTPINDGQWHHVASVFPDGATTITELLHYVDGRLDPRSGGGDQTVNTRIGDGAEPVTIGMRIQVANFQFFPGIVADVRIYDEALEEDEIRELAGLGDAIECTSLSIACEVEEELNNVAVTATVDPDGCDCRRLELFADDVSIGVSDVPADGAIDVRLDLACAGPGEAVELRAVCLGSETSATCQIACPSRQGLVAHWKLDEGVGDVFEDSAGDFDGFLTPVSTIEWTDGPPTQEFAVEFSGVDSWIQTEFPGIGGANPRTVAFWVRTDVADNAPSHGIVGWGASSTSEKWHIRVNNNSGNGVLGAIRTEPEGGQNVATTAINDGEWHHVASVFPEGATMISEVLHYVDGVLDPRSGGGEQAVNTRVGPNAEPATIGMRLQGAAQHFFPGAVADVRIYDEALEEDEILEVMSAGQCLVRRTIGDHLYIPGETVAVTLDARSITGTVTITETFPPGLSVADAGGGMVTDNTIAFSIDAAGTLSYELEVPESFCETITLLGTFAGEGGSCQGDVFGSSDLRCVLGCSDLQPSGAPREMLIIGPIDLGGDTGTSCDDNGNLDVTDYLTDGDTDETNLTVVFGDELSPDFGGDAGGVGVALAPNPEINPRALDGVLTVWLADADSDGRVNFNDADNVGDPLDTYLIYSLVYLRNTTGSPLDVAFEIGSDDAVKVLVNGDQVHVNPVCRGVPAAGSGDFVTDVTLEPGFNTVLIAVVEQGGGTDVRLRVLDDLLLPLTDGSVVACLAPEETGPTGADVVPGDVNGDGTVNISDPVAALDFLFGGGGGQSLVECYFSEDGDGPVTLTEAGLAVLDWNGDRAHNISDPVASLTFQFASGAAHALGRDCTLIPGDCEDSCR